MYYATRTYQIADKIQEHQLLSFYDKKTRNEYVAFEGGESITAAQKNKLQPIGLSHTVRGTAGVYFAQRVMSLGGPTD